jgi:4-amino-4-deoxy-L-arabinose transferase-like glycosyltransferase
LLIAQLVMQACLLAAAFWSHAERLPSPVLDAEQNPRSTLRFSVIFQVGLLVLIAAVMPRWNDEVSNLHQARFLAMHGLRAWIDNYPTLNRWMGPFHPPLLTLLYGGFYTLAGSSLFAGRLFNIAFAAAALAVGARVVRRLTDAPTAALASLCWPLWPLWLFNGAAAVLEAPFLFFALLTIDAFLAFLEDGRASRAAWVGGWLTVTLLGRYNIALLLPGMLLVLLSAKYRPLLRRASTYLMLVVPAAVLIPAAILAAKTGLLSAQLAHLSWVLLLARPGGVHYLVEFMLPLWPLHVGAHLLPLLLLSFGALRFGTEGERRLMLLGGVYLALVLIILPNPRYLLPAAPFLAVGMARVLRGLERRGQGAAAVWFGVLGATLTLTVLVIAGARIGSFYPFY